MEVAKTTADGLAQIRILAEECHMKVNDGKYDGTKLSELADQALAMW